ncbi:ent-kaurene oxidase [Boeremia exigua]|uniref:ent-kaurene oxidase n=1 Tax=Boeremia exigua TaxID=749465 RepID=UPI001E8E0166|nr:ent-kaurene oxidase [Boeremia exigua]KAH6625922.1 ent-kaurene oxidase [Boeremia exigua]
MSFNVSSNEAELSLRLYYSTNMLSLPPVVSAALLVLALTFIGFRPKKSKYPLANPPHRFQLRLFKQLDFMKNGVGIFGEAQRKFPGKPFRIINELGEALILPPSAINLMRNEEGLSFGEAVNRDFHAHIPGFQPFGFIAHHGQIVQVVAKKHLNKYLATITQPLSAEASYAVDLIFGNSSEWKEVRIRDPLLDLVARLSSRVFLGAELCRDENWLKITKEYTINSFQAAVKMTIVPYPLRFIWRLFSKDCAVVARDFNKAVDIITPVIEQRRKLKEEARLKGEKVPSYNDAIEWAEMETQCHPYDPASFQLALSFAAIHTTTDLVSQTMMLLALHSEVLVPLRKEIVDVLQVEGWTKSALFKMRLLDSTIKEAQRIKPNTYTALRRIALKDITLSDNTFIRKGERCMVDATGMLDPKLHPEPEKFDIYRFLRLREQPEFANKAQLVATSPEHLIFGHGMHACPGRFFAANEVKIALIHLILKYEWKLLPGITSIKPVIMGVNLRVDPDSRLLYRRRKEEVNLESLGFE